MNPEQIRLLEKIHNSNLNHPVLRFWHLEKDGRYYFGIKDNPDGLSQTEFEALNKDGCIDFVCSEDLTISHKIE